MNLFATFVVDSEYVDGMFRRVCGNHVSPDILKIHSYFQQVGRTILWTRWYVQEPLNEHPSARYRREAYYARLKYCGVRVIVCRSKPISQARSQHEENVCDFEVSEGIRLGTSKSSTVIVATGDGHLATAIRNAHEQAGCRVEILCDRQSLSSTIEADYFHYAEDMIAAGYELTRQRRARKPRSLQASS